MPELKCTVQTCVHNKQFLCDLDAIEVGGSSAKNAEETCCDYIFRKEKETVTAIVTVMFQVRRLQTEAKLTVRRQIVCTMKNASAMQEKISAEGSNACDCDGTECATFTCK